MCAFSGIFSGSPSFNSNIAYILMLLGRLLFSLGGENLNVA